MPTVRYQHLTGHAQLHNGAGSTFTMVKPPKTMEPEAINLRKAGRDASKAFGQDSFRNYMGRKIDLQRRQFGLLLPPSSPGSFSSMQSQQMSITDPSVKDRNERKNRRYGDDSGSECTDTGSKSKPKKRLTFGIVGVVQKLEKKHGASRKRPPSAIEALDRRSPSKVELSLSIKSASPSSPVLPKKQRRDCTSRPGSTVKKRRDLFFSGVVVIVNGYTNPDTETLQRLLHRHGGDLEKYETSRVTHIIAESLSTAKAKIYKSQKRPRPVCKPSWITESIAARALLPASRFLIDEVKSDGSNGVQSVAGFFGKKESDEPKQPAAQENYYGDQTGLLPKLSTGPDRIPVHATNNSQSVQVKPQCSSLCQASDILSPSKVPLKQSDVIVCREEKSCSILGGEVCDRKNESTTLNSSPAGKTSNSTYLNGKVRTVGTDPKFLESFFAASRLSFIGSYKQRSKPSPTKTARRMGNNSKRFVFHVDLDSFFASVVLRNYPQYRDQPVAISHHGERRGEISKDRRIPQNSSSECATCNYEARKFGITKGMYLGQAKALCPNLIVLQYDFQGYEEVSEAMYNILDNHSTKHNGAVEHVSCDEAYIEVYFELEGDGSSTTILVKQMAETIRNEIFEATQCTASVGVASNKLLAKLATDFVKPNRSFVAHDSKELLRPLKLKQLHGIGYRLNQRLEESGLVTIQDVWDMGSRGEAELCRLLGPGLGKKVHGFCNGKDNRRVEPAERKTIGAEVRCVDS